MPLMRLLFTDLPDEKPRITGIKEKYQIGERLEALCTSWQSHPPANLTWWINEEKVFFLFFFIRRGEGDGDDGGDNGDGDYGGDNGDGDGHDDDDGGPLHILAVSTTSQPGVWTWCWSTE